MKTDLSRKADITALRMATVGPWSAKNSEYDATLLPSLKSFDRVKKDTILAQFTSNDSVQVDTTPPEHKSPLFT